MGICCARTIDQEPYLVSIFIDPHFKLITYDYNQLLNTIVSFRIDNSIHIKQIKEKIIPQFFDKNDTSNRYLKYHQALFDYILDNLEEKNNIYQVLFYFYPFINHSNENTVEKLFEIFNLIKLSIKTSQLVNLFSKYIKFLTFDLTFIIWSQEQNKNIKRRLEELKETFSEKHAYETANRLLFPLIQELGMDEVVTKELFKKTLKNYNIGGFMRIREIVYIEYHQK